MNKRMKSRELPTTSPRQQATPASLEVEQPVANRMPGHEDLIARSLVKTLATVASMTWNYFWYRFYAFREL